MIENAAACLCELSQDPSIVQTMVREGAVAILTKLLKSSDDQTITLYTCMTLHRITQINNQEVIKPLNPDMMTAIQPPIIAQPGNVTPVSL